LALFDFKFSIRTPENEIADTSNIVFIQFCPAGAPENEERYDYIARSFKREFKNAMGKKSKKINFVKIPVGLLEDSQLI
jgi:hypothetical protein